MGAIRFEGRRLWLTRARSNLLRRRRFWRECRHLRSERLVAGPMQPRPRHSGPRSRVPFSQTRSRNLVGLHARASAIAGLRPGGAARPGTRQTRASQCRRPCGRLAGSAEGPALPKLRESPRWLLAARPAATCKHTWLSVGAVSGVYAGVGVGASADNARSVCRDRRRPVRRRPRSGRAVAAWARAMITAAGLARCRVLAIVGPYDVEVIDRAAHLERLAHLVTAEPGPHRRSVFAGARRAVIRTRMPVESRKDRARVVARVLPLHDRHYRFGASRSSPCAGARASGCSESSSASPRSRVESAREF